MSNCTFSNRQHTTLPSHPLPQRRPLGRRRVHRPLGPRQRKLDHHLGTPRRRRRGVFEPVEAVALGEGEVAVRSSALAEDDEAVCSLARRILEGAGYTVLVAADGSLAVEVFKARAGEIALAVLDVVMPKLGGREACEQMKAINPNLRVLYSSGYTANAVHPQFLLDEGLHLLQKPYGPDALLRKVRDVLDA